MKSSDYLIKNELPTENQKMLAEKHNEEKIGTILLIVRIMLISHHF